ncbi:trypsin-like serine peptidase [Actinomadura opuntiae]|uniref:trypsin-like serine peptidase n=1 Tax=Actinomadura sp. OS1-43 TaxID=604315 RepID=UPI00255AE33F|nr:trypsin-like serine protease [Actinomadura sp. OS1-43]MDL4818102.1 trypsin-like serine protease [Actinomadura sp. OS1-43]
MRNRWMRWTAAGGACAGIVAAGAGTVWYTAGDARGRTVVDTSASMRVSAADANDASRYWTPKRMAAATPVDRRSGGVTGQTFSSQAIVQSKAFGGVPTIGALFFNNGQGDHFCTASVVQSSSQRLLITAAHCIHGGKGKKYATKVAFVPKYDQGKRPYGTWTAKMLLVDQRWVTSTDPDLDFGFIALNDRSGKTIQKAVGYNKLAINQGTGKTVNVAGYPKIAFDPRDRPIYCRTKTAKQSQFQIRMDCTGFYGGTSGSPWLLNYSYTTQKGDINGVIGGYQGGGNTASRSYSAYFDKDVYNLRAAADKRAA